MLDDDNRVGRPILSAEEIEFSRNRQLQDERFKLENDVLIKLQNLFQNNQSSLLSLSDLDEIFRK